MSNNLFKLEAQNCDSNSSSISIQSGSSSNISISSRQMSPEPAIKRPRLNFSIESIMKSSSTTTNSSSSNNHNNNTTTKSSSSSSSSTSSTTTPNSHNIDVKSCAPNYTHHSSSQQPSTSTKRNSSSTNHNQCSTSSNGGDNSRLSRVECVLDNKDMWDKFHSLNTEMIITKTGRRMFPVMKVQFHNLEPNARYAVSMDIVPVDNKRYRYAYHKSCWQVAGKADPSAEPRLYPHPDSPFNGDLLSRQVISFEKVKLTNNEMDKSGHIILNSMHKYQPRVHLIELKVPPPQSNTQNTSPTSSSYGGTGSRSGDHHQNQHHNHHHHQQQQQQRPQLDIEGYRTFVFPETVFTAVTAYQNQLITKMKIDKNPFAKGFRDSSRLSDLDRNDPFDYMGSLGPSAGRYPGQPGGPGGPLDAAAAAAAAAAGAHMDAYQLFASAANNPWYSAAALAAAAGGANPFNSMGPCANSSAQAAQLQTQMWLAALSACLNNGAAGQAPGAPPTGAVPTSVSSSLGALGASAEAILAGVPVSGQSPHLNTVSNDQSMGGGGGRGGGGGGSENGPDSSSVGSSSSIANCSGTSS